jgi:hypothetical protein
LGAYLLTKGIWQVSVIPTLWFIGIVASQAVYGRCVILEYISRLKKKLPKGSEKENYLLKDFLAYRKALVVKDHKNLTIITHVEEKADLHYAEEFRRYVGSQC